MFQALVMSSVVRHMFATSPQLRSGPVLAWMLLGLMLYTIGRPVAASASRIFANVATCSSMLPLGEHQSYLRKSTPHAANCRASCASWPWLPVAPG